MKSFHHLEMQVTCTNLVPSHIVAGFQLSFEDGSSGSNPVFSDFYILTLSIRQPVGRLFAVKYQMLSSQMLSSR